MHEPQKTNCSDVNQLLSAYYDEQLAPEKRTVVAEHVAGCDACARELEGFRGLSAMATRLEQPEPPAGLWQQLESQLDGGAGHGDRSERPALAGRLAWTRRPSVRFGFAAAAVILLAVGWFGYRTWSEHGGEHPTAAVFAKYVEQLRRDPDAAQQVLLAAYQGKAMAAGQAIRAVGYRPAVADGLPDGYSVERTYVMEMPCCTCVQCVCKRSDGTTFAIFEHGAAESDEQIAWFGDRAEKTAVCRGKPCCLVELDDRIAATWKHGKRQITVVGVQNTAEIDRLVAWFDDRRRILQQ